MLIYLSEIRFRVALCLYVVFSVFLLNSSAAQAQSFNTREWLHWYFGPMQAIRFDKSPPTVLSDSRMNTWENSATISDAQGNLLLYTNGDTLYNGRHQSLGRLTPDWGHNAGSCWDGVVILRQPGQDSLYYIFTAPPQEYIASQRWFQYALVNAKVGEIRKIQQHLHEAAPDARGEVLGLTHHATEDAWWVISKDNNLSFRTYKLDKYGLDTHAVISAHFADTVPLYGGYIAFDASGRRMAHSMGVFSFDPATGKVVRILARLPHIAQHLAFAPSGNYLYYKSTSSSDLFQADLTKVDTGIGLRTLYKLGRQQQMNALMLGPDGVIYINTEGGLELSTVNRPEDKMNCDFRYANIKLAHASGVGFGLPLVPAAQAKAFIQGDTLCGKTRLWLEGGHILDSLLWQYDRSDGHAPGKSKTDTLELEYTGTVDFHINVQMYRMGLTDSTEANIHAGAPVALEPEVKHLTLCPQKPHMLAGRAGADRWTWNDSALTRKKEAKAPGVYWVESVAGHCIVRDSFYLNASPDFTLNMPDTLSLTCGDTLQLGPDTTYSFVDYVWSDGLALSHRSVTKTGLYILTAADSCAEKTASVRVIGEDCVCQLFVPNAFTPEGTTLNDRFSPVSDCPFLQYKFSIWNRWGERLYETTDPTAAWDGSFRGKIVQEGVYLYMVSYQQPGDHRRLRKGTLHLLR